MLVWAVAAMTWLANSVRTRGVDDELLRSSNGVSVVDGATTLEFLPPTASSAAGLVFICGGGVAAPAYAPLLRPVADAGYPVFIVRLPFRFAPFASHKDEAITRAHQVIASHHAIRHWVIAGHSLGGALAARMVHASPQLVSGLMLMATTHPRDQDLSSLQLPVTKVYGTNDGVAPAATVQANARLLPPHTKWVAIDGGNHSQFGHYGHQLFDGTATISRDAQQTLVRSELLTMLSLVAR
jgi:pimeloyl-ACP methyl ester carboxylesterase